MLRDHYGLTYLFNQAFESYSSAVVVAADRAKIIPLLVAHPEGLTATVIADTLALDPQVTALIMPALRHLGLVETTGDRYRATELAARHLNPDAPSYAGPWLAAMHAACWNEMGQLSGYLMGEIPLRNKIYELSDEESVAMTAVWTALNPMGVASAEAFVEQVDLSRCRRLMDVGTATAAFIIATLRAVPQASATAVDLPHMADTIRTCTDKAGLSDRVEVVSADLFTDDLPTGYDTVFVNNVFHSWDTERRAVGLAKCFRSLEPGGTLYIVEHMLEENGDSRPTAAEMVGLTLLVQTGQGGAFTIPDFSQALREAGFVDIKAIPFPDQPAGTHILSGQKP